jgi:endo-1,4-beta-xylanase
MKTMLLTRVGRSGPKSSMPGFICAATALSVCSATAQTSLREAADKVGLNFGAAVTGQSVGGTSNQNYKDIVRTEFNTVVCENDMKWASTQPSRGQFNYAGGDRVVGFASTNGMKVRGHTFVWHSQAGWVANYNGSRAEMLAAMKTHIENVGAHYKGKILEWDVVNEAVADGSTQLRNSFWRQRVGDDFIDSAFAYAHRVDPNALLFYNDYGAEDMGAKSNGVYNLVKRMKENGIPIHGVGLQCHFSGSSIRKADIDRNIKRLGALGLRVAITELDIVDASRSTQPWKDLMDICMANENCTTFMTWGVYDAMSWRANGGNCNCLIYDTQLKAKSIHAALLSSMAAADPSVTAKRKAFTGTPSPIVQGQLWRRPYSRLIRQGIALPVLKVGQSKGVDARGRISLLAHAR